MAQVWRPMRTALTSGQATDLEAKVRLKEAKLIVGPGAANLHRGRDYQAFISNILRYSSGWSNLQWTSKKYFTLPSAPNVEWYDGTRPTYPSFVGESGGCIYSISSSPGSSHSQLFVVRPPSERTGRQDTHFTLNVDFHIRGVAIDVASKEVVLLEIRQNGDALFHFYDFYDKILREPYFWHADWRSEMIVRQFEVIDGMLGLLTAPASAPAGWSIFLDWKKSRDVLQWPHITEDGDHWSFQFITRDLVLISEESIRQGNYMRAAHLRLVSLNHNHRTSQEPQNRWIQELPLAGLQAFERVHRATLVPYLAPIEGQKLDHAAPFCFDPSQRLIGIKYEYQRHWGEVQHVLEVAQLGRGGLRRLQSLNYPPMHQIAGNYAFIGRQLMWPMRISPDEGRKGVYIRSVDFDMTPGAHLSPRTSNQHPTDKDWVVIKDSTILNRNPRLPPIPVNTTFNPPPGAFRALFTQDNIIFLIKGDRLGLPEFQFCGLMYNF